MTEDRARPEWSEEDLDRALVALRDGGSRGDGDLAGARARLRAAIAADATSAHVIVADAVAPDPPRRTWRRRAAGTAVAAALAAAVLIVPGTPAGDRAVASAAAEVLELAAVRTETAAGPPGPYRYVATRGWYLSSATAAGGAPLSTLEGVLDEVWIPADRADEWGRRSRATGERQWLAGSEELARTEDGGLLVAADDRPLERGRCGDRPGANPPLGADPPAGLPCAERPGDWWRPTARFLAELPRDPDRLLARLRDGAPEGLDPDAHALSSALELLRTQQAPADLQGAVYRALRLLPGLEVVDRAVDLDGRAGTALGRTNGTERDEIVLDPADGTFLGERVVLAQPGTGSWEGLPAGTVVQWTSVRSAAVERIGDVPD